jgi:hypothetical protein
VRLVYDPKGLPRVTTARPGVAGVLQYFINNLKWLHMNINSITVPGGPLNMLGVNNNWEQSSQKICAVAFSY